MAEHLVGALTAAAILILSVFCGSKLWLGKHRKHFDSFTEFAVAAIGLGTCVLLVVALVLTYTGVFGSLQVMGALAIASVVLAARAGIGFSMPAPRTDEALAAVVCLVFLGYCAKMRFHDVEGLRDGGVYVGSAIELARTGDLGWRDPLLLRHGINETGHLLQDWKDYFAGKPRWERFSGFYIRDTATARVQPQFLHTHEQLLALAYSFAGPQATQVVNAMLAASALFAFFGVISILTTSSTAVAAVLLLACNPGQLWFARASANEMLLQLLLWSFAYLYLLLRQVQGASLSRVIIVLLPLVMAAATKFAAWPLLPLFAFESGRLVRAGRLPVLPLKLWTAFTGAAIAIWLYASATAEFYVYGTWRISASKLGVSYEMIPLLWTLATPAAFSLGMLAWPVFARLERYWTYRHFRILVVSAVMVLAAAVLGLQRHRYQLPGIEADFWSESTNFYELSFYFRLPVLLGGLAGLALLLLRRPSGIVVVMLVVAGTLIASKNLDSIHPWGARRWVPVVIPMICLGCGGIVGAVWQAGKSPTTRIIGRAGAMGLLAAMVILEITAAPQLIRTKQFRGIIPQLDQLASMMKPSDLVLAQPTSAVMKHAPFLKARHDIDIYPQPASADGWTSSLPLIRNAARADRRIMYLSDEPLTTTLEQGDALIYTGEVTLKYPWLPDMPHRLGLPTEVSQPLYLFRLKPEVMRNSWWLRKPRREPTEPPLKLGLDDNARLYLRGFFPPTPLPDGTSLRWTNGSGFIDIGLLVKFPITKPELTLTVRMSGGRPLSKEPIRVNWYFAGTVDDYSRQVAISFVGPELRDYSVTVPSDLFTRNTHILLDSLRNRVEDAVPAGVVGVQVQEIRIE